MKRLKTFQKQIKETKKDTQKHGASKKIRNEDKKLPTKDLNLQPSDYQSNALLTELDGHVSRRLLS